jgi:hypothetical protein
VVEKKKFPRFSFIYGTRIKPDNLTVSDAQESVCDSAFGQASASKG